MKIKLTMKYMKPTLVAAALILNFSLALDLPEDMTLEYSGPYGIPAKLKFSHDHKTYKIDTTIAIPFKKMSFTTKGIIKNNQLLPTEYVTYRDGKVYSSSIFDYANNSLTYGKLPDRTKAKLPKNTQDLFTVAWQMTANKGLPAKGTHTTNGKKLYELPQMVQVKDTSHFINQKREDSLYYKGGEGNQQIEVGLAKNLHFIPSVIVYYDKGTRYELNLRKVIFKKI